MADPIEPSAADVDDYLRSLHDERRRGEALRLKGIFEHCTELPAVLWSGGIVGFGERHYRYESGHEGDTFLVGFAPRDRQHVLYGLYSAYDDADGDLLDGLGSYTTGKSCIYVKRLDDINTAALETLIRNVVATAPGG